MWKRKIEIVSGPILDSIANFAFLHFVFFFIELLFLDPAVPVKCTSLRDTDFSMRDNDRCIDVLCGGCFFSQDLHYVKSFWILNMFAFAFLIVPYWIWFDNNWKFIDKETKMIESEEMSPLPMESRQWRTDRAAMNISDLCWTLAYYFQIFCELFGLVSAGFSARFLFNSVTHHMDTFSWDQIQIPFFPYLGNCTFEFEEDNVYYYGTCQVRYHAIYELMYFILVAYYAFAAMRIMVSLVSSFLVFCSRKKRRNWFVTQVSSQLDEEDLQVLADKGSMSSLYKLYIHAKVMDPEDFLRLAKSYKKLQKPGNQEDN